MSNLVRVKVVICLNIIIIITFEVLNDLKYYNTEKYISIFKISF